MSCFRWFVLAVGLFVVMPLSGCGSSSPNSPPAPQTVASSEGTNLGSATFQANPSAGAPAPAATATTVSPPTVAPPVVGPVVTGPTTSGPVANSTAMPLPPSAQPNTVPGPTVVGPTVGGAVPPPTVTPAAPAAAATSAPGTPNPGTPAAGTPTTAAAPPASASANFAAGAVASGDMAGLANGTNQWRLQGMGLVGVKRFKDKPVGAGYSWMTSLLPYIGYQELYAKFDFAKGWHEKENLPFACQVVPAFLDPSNPNHNQKSPLIKDAIGPAFTHFVGMSGVEDSRNLVAAALPRSDPRAGIFGYDQVARPEEITDGAGNTIMLISSGKISGAWISGGGATIRAARMPYFDAITGFGTAGDPGAGALVAMADGSVRRISKDIDPAVFRALCTIHGSETIDMAANANVIRAQ